MSAIQEQINKLDAIRGETGSHHDLAEKLEALGFEVQLDSDDNEHSWVKLPGAWHPDGSDIVVAEIRGDAEARIV